MSGLLFLSLEFLLRVAIVGFLCFFFQSQTCNVSHLGLTS